VADTAGAASGAGHEQAPPDDQTREYLRQVRSLPAGQLLGEVMFSLLNAAQVKLGRRDARLLIDVCTVAHEHARPYLPGDLTGQIDQALGQLRLAQVSAESERGKPEDNDLDRVPAPPPAGAPPSPGGQPASKLWVPGR
jgi:hypothetical protein